MASSLTISPPPRQSPAPQPARSRHGRARARFDRPSLLAHIIPVRRCNLACTYCNEFDDFSKPVATDEMFRRIDKLGALGTAVVTISGGEPLLHPELDNVIRRIRSQRHDCRAHHQRLSAGRGSHPAPQSRRPGVAADFHRQRQSRRSLQEEPESSRQETADCSPSTPTFT